jgi:chloramphenicol 3-O-phosphotransferase
VFYPLGYPLVVESEATEPLRIAAQCWGTRRKLFDAPPLRLTIHPELGDPPVATPIYRASPDGFWLACDAVTRGAYSLRAHAACLHVSRALLDQPEWFRYQLLDCLVLTALDTVHFVGIHAACVVSPEGRGILLCGESGSGKSTLAYACARAGWTFVSDDSHLALASDTVTGNSDKLRLREPARELFPELHARPAVTAPNGKQCIEIDPAQQFAVSEAAAAHHCVFLSRRPGPAALHAYSAQDAVEYFMRYNTRYDRSGAVRRLREFVVSPLLLAYEDLDDAIEVLGRLP